MPIFQTTYKDEMERFGSHKDYYEHLLNEGSIEAHRRVNIETLDNIVDVERGPDVCRDELALMHNVANRSQKSVFSQITTELQLNSTAIVSGAAGTGKSFVLRIWKDTISSNTTRFFGLTNVSSVPNFLILDEYIKLYPKIILLIDEYSMISSKLLESINDALVKTTQRATVMGGVKTIFFGDVAQLLPIQQKEGKICESEIFNAVPRYSLHDPVRQQDERFIDILNKVRNYEFVESVVSFINERTVHKTQLPLSCLRLYTTRQRVAIANERDYAEFSGEGQEFQAYDTFVGNKRTAKIALRETRLLECLLIKPNMPVMLIHNLHIPTGWVNGTIALIEYMEEENICLKKRLPNGNDAIYWIQRISRQVPGTSYTRTQFPIVPAFATTIHEAQSAIIDCVGIHLDHMLSHGQLYVAMPCFRKLEDLYFFGAETPLNVKRKFDADVYAVEIIRKKKRI